MHPGQSLRVGFWRYDDYGPFDEAILTFYVRGVSGPLDRG